MDPLLGPAFCRGRSHRLLRVGGLAGGTPFRKALRWRKLLQPACQGIPLRPPEPPGGGARGRPQAQGPLRPETERALRDARRQLLQGKVLPLFWASSGPGALRAVRRRLRPRTRRPAGRVPFLLGGVPRGRLPHDTGKPPVFPGPRPRGRARRDRRDGARHHGPGAAPAPAGLRGRGILRGRVLPPFAALPLPIPPQGAKAGLARLREPVLRPRHRLARHLPLRGRVPAGPGPARAAAGRRLRRRRPLPDRARVRGHPSRRPRDRGPPALQRPSFRQPVRVWISLRLFGRERVEQHALQPVLCLVQLQGLPFCPRPPERLFPVCPGSLPAADARRVHGGRGPLWHLPQHPVRAPRARVAACLRAPPEAEAVRRGRRDRIARRRRGHLHVPVRRQPVHGRFPPGPGDPGRHWVLGACGPSCRADRHGRHRGLLGASGLVRPLQPFRVIRAQRVPAHQQPGHLPAPRPCIRFSAPPPGPLFGANLRAAGNHRETPG